MEGLGVLVTTEAFGACLGDATEHARGEHAAAGGVSRTRNRDLARANAPACRHTNQLVAIIAMATTGASATAHAAM
jgi:hypothetical protein